MEQAQSVALIDSDTILESIEDTQLDLLEIQQLILSLALCSRPLQSPGAPSREQ